MRYFLWATKYSKCYFLQANNIQNVFVCRHLSRHATGFLRRSSSKLKLKNPPISDENVDAATVAGPVEEPPIISDSEMRDQKEPIRENLHSCSQCPQNFASKSEQLTVLENWGFYVATGISYKGV